MDFGFTTAAYVVAAVLFILSLGGLSGQESAKRAVWYGIVGMALAVFATLIGPGAGLWLLSSDSDRGRCRCGRLRRAARPDDRDAAACGRDAQPRRPCCSLCGPECTYRDRKGCRSLRCCRSGVPAGRSRQARSGVLDQFRGFAAVVAKKTGVEINILRMELFLGV